MDQMNEKEAIRVIELLYTAKDRKALLEISSNQQLNPQVRQYAAGLLMKPWLPWGMLRQMIMFCLLLLGLFGFFITGKLVFFIPVILALSFSPRFVGEFLFLFSRKS